MASEQGTVEIPQEEKVEETTPEQTPTTTEEAAPAAEPEPTTATPTEEEAPAKPSTKEKISGMIHQTGDKIKGTVTGIKEKVSSKK